MNFTDNVERMTANITAAIRTARRQGITTMSKDNLRQMTSFRDCSFPNPNVAYRCFDEALGIALKQTKFRVLA